MKQETTLKILRALLNMDSGGELYGGLMLSQVRDCSGVSRATTYRYLVKLKACGLVETNQSSWNGEPMSLWNISSEGIKYVAQKI